MKEFMDAFIVYEDKEIIVCRKKAGIPVQSARIGQKDMVSILSNYLAMERGIEGAMELHVVHRLDQPVEGLIVFAKTRRAASELGRQAADGRMKKVYRAVCCVRDVDKLKNCGKTVRLTDYLWKDGRRNVSCISEEKQKDAKRAELSYTILDTAEVTGQKYVLAEIRLKTGRHHQIRVQMAHEGLPLYGDQKYNPAFLGENRSELALCAVSLGFLHPATKKKMEFDTKPGTEGFHIFEGASE